MRRRKMAVLSGHRAFSPLDISGLQLWLDANDLTTLFQDSALTTPVTANNQKVGGWTNKATGATTNALQATAGVRPTYLTNRIGGKPVVHFDDDDLAWMSLTGLSIASGSKTIVSVFLSERDSTDLFIMDVQTGRLVIPTHTATGWLGWFDGSWKNIAYSAPVAQIVTWVLTSGGNGEIFIDGLSYGTAAYTAKAIGGNIALASHNAGALNKTDIELAEHFIFDTALSDANRIALNQYLTTKYSITYRNSRAKTNLTDLHQVQVWEIPAGQVVPVGAGGASDNKIREIGNVLYEPTDTGKEYKFWYTGYNTGANTDEKIHYATSTDGTTWTKNAGNPVIADRAEDPYVVKSGTTYYLYAEDKAEGSQTKIRRWHCDDAVTWVDDGDITGISDCQSPVVWIEGATWYLLYEHYPTEPLDVRLATSTDGLAWTDEASNPVFSASDTAWVTGATVVPDDIVKIGSTYYMFYHGKTSSDNQMHEGIATSTNLTTWTDYASNPIGRGMATVSVFYDTQYTCLFYSNLTDSRGVFRGYPTKFT